MGQRFTVKNIPERYMQPITFQDVYQSMREQGVPAGTALAVLSIFGASVQTHDNYTRR